MVIDISPILGFFILAIVAMYVWRVTENRR